MTDVDHGKAAWNVVSALCNAVDSGEHSLGTVPGLVKRVLAEGSWREFTPPGAVGPIRHERFEDFVTAQPTNGLGASRELMEKIVQGTDAEVPLRQAFLGKRGPKPADSSRNNVTETVTGNRRDYTLDRLQRDAPELFDAVQRKELSPNAAAIRAGFRPKSFTVRADRPESIVGTLRRQLDAKTLAMVTKLLSEEN